MDGITFRILKKANLKKAELIRLKDFEDEGLAKVKKGRTQEEYCWTSKPSLLSYILKKYPSLDMITYLDADLFFYNDPYPIYEEFSDNSVLIVKHCYSPEFLHLKKTSGIYNAGMVIFRNDKEGRKCLERWRKQCLDWCFHRIEEGKMSDQLYLNDWPQRFKKVKILQHKGANVALWNFKNYKIENRKGNIYINDDLLIFYHFHGFKILSKKRFSSTSGSYHLTRNLIKVIYQPYIKVIQKMIDKVANLDSTFKFDYSPEDKIYFRLKIRITELLKKIHLYKIIHLFWHHMRSYICY